jgi:hypothetical protein
MEVAVMFFQITFISAALAWLYFLVVKPWRQRPASSALSTYFLSAFVRHSILIKVDSRAPQLRGRPYPPTRR